MSIVGQLKLGMGRRLPFVYQTETTECGLACIAMIGDYHGLQLDIATLRRRFPVSLRGVTLNFLIRVARELDMNSRALRADLDELDQLQTPCVLHWEFDHFVVLREINRHGVVIHDPGVGVRTLPLSEVSKAFTGVVLEVWPAPTFRPRDEKPKLSWRMFVGRLSGVKTVLWQILALALAIEVCSLLFPFFTEWVIDDVIVAGDRDLLATLALAFGGLMLFQQAVVAARGWVIMFLENSLGIQWRANVFDHLVRLPVEYFMKRHLGDIVSRFGSIDQIQKTLTTSFITALLDGVMSITTLVLMFVFSWQLSLVTVAALVLYIGIRWMRYSALRGATEGQLVSQAKQQTHFLETVRGIKSIKLFQREDDRRMHWLQLVVRQTNATIRTQKAQLLFQTAHGLLSGIERIAIIWWGAHKVIEDQLTVGALMAFVGYKDQFDTRITSLVDKLYDVKMLGLQGRRLADIVLTRSEDSRPVRPIDPDTATEELPSIELRNVSYRYGEHEPDVLSGIDLLIRPGETVAITGPSGGGKTTLLNIILGILAPTEGELLVGGTNARHSGPKFLRKITASVTQDDVLFAGSIADNICFFDPRPDTSAIEDCARRAAIHDDIGAMPMGYRTLVGDMGTVLSGGQKQRILLARALYKRPLVLVLDEATSHLDAVVESRILKTIAAMQVTRIMVAHRRETICAADRVIVVNNGRASSDVLVGDWQPAPIDADRQALAASA